MTDPILTEWEALKQRCKDAAAVNGGKVPADLVAECGALLGRAMASIDNHPNRSEV